MSGIVGLLNLDGAPIDRALLERMTEFMTFRGPDDQQVWLEEAVGFGHTMLRTTWEAEYEHQPFTLDRQVWIVADARIDDRDTLAQKLGIAPLPSPPFGKETKVITDVELILRAYLEWGDRCVDHLLGDFAFAIWDGRKQRLFCARDQFGVKLFYYSRVGNCLIISNTLNCIRQHPRVSSDLNEAAIGDFLLFDANYNLETTTFLDIQRLLPAHTLTYSNQNIIQTRKYWTLPLPELTRYQNSQDYIDRFREIMGQAVADRLRTEKVSIFFSGGLDSTTIAATALTVAKQNALPLDLRALTVVYDRLIPDRERYYSGVAAQALNLPIDYLVADDYPLFEAQNRPNFSTPEPCNEPTLNIYFDQFDRISAHSRVVLYGQGGDEVLAGATVTDIFKVSSWRDGLCDLKQSLWDYRLRPPLGSGIHAWLKQQQRTPLDQTFYPPWLNPSFAKRLSLSDRWQQIMDMREINFSPRPHQRSPAYNKVISHIGSFASYDSEFLDRSVDIRFAFLDLRVVKYTIGLPALPWCINKALLRIAMKDLLPPEICQRPKAPMAGDPIGIKICKISLKSERTPSQELIEPYVSLVDWLEAKNTQSNIWQTWQNFRPMALSCWLKDSN